MAKKDIQYPYAVDEQNNLIYIEDVHRENRHDHSYRCPNCGHSMLPRLGDHNAHCFAHSENQTCGVESYIHKMAKLILTKRFNDRSRPFTVRFQAKRICKEKEVCKDYKQYFCENILMDEFDLHQFYDLPAIEEVRIKDSSGEVFQPDVIIRSSNGNRAPIYLEVYHKHRISSQKQESGNCIIEIRVNDWYELLNLDQLCLEESERISFYNFKERRMKREEFRRMSDEIALLNEDIDIDSLLPLCYRSKNSKREFLPNIRLIMYQSGKRFSCGIFEDEMDKHKKSAIADITYNCQRLPDTFDPLSVLVERVPKARRCTMCCHCRQNEFETNMWCELVKNGSLRKNTFDNQKGIVCSSFERWTPIDNQSDFSLKEGIDYGIWINPKFS